MFLIVKASWCVLPGSLEPTYAANFSESEDISLPNRAFPDLENHFQNLKIALIALDLH